MAISAIHSYLVYPSKADDEQPAIGGAKLALTGSLHKMLLSVYDKSDTECDIDISFNHNDDGEQQNNCRDLILKYVAHPSLPGGRKIAEKLQSVTTHRSGLGLLFLMAGKSDRQHKLVVSRFPAETGILAEQTKEELTVEYIEKIFMKSANKYKAALYLGGSTASDFWDGTAVDNQRNAQTVEISDYWIKDFLESDLKTTSALGTKRLADAIRKALKASDSLAVKEQLLAVARLSSGLQGKSVSIRSVASRFKLDDEATQALNDQLHNDKVFTEQFRFSRNEFDANIAFESTELNNGGILMAPAGSFKDVFHERRVQGSDDEYEFTTTGRIVNRKLRKAKI